MAPSGKGKAEQAPAKVQGTLRKFAVGNVVEKVYLSREDPMVQEVQRMHANKEQLDLSQMEALEEIESLQEKINRDSKKLEEDAEDEDSFILGGQVLKARQDEVNRRLKQWQAAVKQIELVHQVFRLADKAVKHYHACKKTDKDAVAVSFAMFIKKISKSLIQPYWDARDQIIEVCQQYCEQSDETWSKKFHLLDTEEEGRGSGSSSCCCCRC